MRYIPLALSMPLLTAGYDNATLNDDQYEYDTPDLPFLAKLGRRIYAYELARERTHLPDLSEFQPNYIGE